jgi:hypothetical protein
MIRRRGNTRQEERMIKELQIQNAEARLDMQKKENEASLEVSEKAYQEAMDAITEFYDKQQHEINEMKDIRDDEITDMQEDYDRQTGLFEDYTDELESQYTNLYFAHYAYMVQLKKTNPEIAALMEETFGISIPESVKKANKSIIELLENYQKYKDAVSDTGTGGGGTPHGSSGMSLSDGASSGSSGMSRGRTASEVIIAATERPIMGRFMDMFGFQRGTHYVPETKPYLLHRGETVNPAGAGGGDVNITINNNNTVSSDVDIERLASLQADMIASKLANKKNGRTNVRLR